MRTLLALFLAPAIAGCGMLVDARRLAIGEPLAAAPLPQRPPVGVATRDYDDAPTGRRLATTIWYPAAEGTREERIWWDGIFPGHGAWHAPWRMAARRPLVVLSHGSGGDATNLAWLAEALASRGYVAAAVDHPGDRFGDATDAGRFAVWRRARDVRVVIDRILEDPELGSHVDPRRIAAAGHSAGGVTVLLLSGARFRPAAMVAHCRSPEAGPDCALLGEVDLGAFADLDDATRSQRDRRVRAVIALAPVFGPGVTTASLRAMRVPVTLAASTTDELVPFRQNAGAYARRIPGARMTRVPRAGHFVFMPVCTEAGRLIVEQVCVDPADVDRAAVHARTAKLAIAFLDRALAR